MSPPLESGLGATGLFCPFVVGILPAPAPAPANQREAGRLPGTWNQHQILRMLTQK